jgi:hypothetical protein
MPGPQPLEIANCAIPTFPLVFGCSTESERRHGGGSLRRLLLQSENAALVAISPCVNMAGEILF